MKNRQNRFNIINPINMFKSKLFIALLLVSGTGVSAQVKKTINDWKSATAAGYSYKYVTGDPTATRFYTLKNGLTVILSPSHKKPRIQTLIAVKAGSKTDPSDHTGLAHYLEHMMFKGTQQFGSQDWAKEKPYLDKIDGLYEQYNSTTDENKRREIYKEIDKTSGEAAKYAIANEYDKMMASIGSQNSNAFTSVEQTVYTEDIPVNSVDQFLAIQAERFKDPVFRIFHTELEAVYEEKNRGLDNDGSKVWEALDAALFPNNNYGKQTTIGTVEHLKNPSLKEIRKYYNTYYVPNNMGIILAGDFNPDVMIKKVDAAFAYMKSKPVPPYTFDPEKPITSPITREVWGPTPEMLSMAYRFPGAGTADAQLMSVIASILSNGNAGLFDLNLIKKQKALGVSAFPNSMKDYSYMVIQGRPQKGQSLNELKSLILAEIEKLKSGSFDNDLLLSIVNNQKKDQLQEDLDYSKRASGIMDAFTSGIDWKSVVTKNARFSKLTKKDVVDFANRYFKNNYVVVLKRQGEDKSIVKVEKPPITPVEVNRDAQSAFLKAIETMPSAAVTPQWLDFNKDIQHSKAGKYELLSVQNKDNSIFKVYYHYPLGQWNIKLLPLAIRYLDFLGTDKMSSEQISKEFYKLAASFQLSASKEDTYVTIEGLQENFAATLSLFENLIRHCQADENALANLKQSLKKERENSKQNKAYIMGGLTSYAQYGKDNPFNYTLSDAELESITADQLLSVLHALPNYMHEVLYYGPNTGNMLAESISKTHVSPASFLPIPAAKQFHKLEQQSSKVLFADFDMVQAELRWVYNGPEYISTNTPMISLFNTYFGSGMGSIVFQTIRESKALAYSTSALYQEPLKSGDRYIMTAYVGTQSDKLNDAAKGMNELLSTLPESEKNLTIAKNSLQQSMASERITDDEILTQYLASKKLGVDYDIRKDVYEKTPTIDFNSMKNFYTNNISGKPYTYCVVASAKRVKEDDLKKYGEVQKLDLKDIFGY